MEKQDMSTISDNMRTHAARDLHQTVEATGNILHMIGELTSNERMNVNELRHAAETLLDLWESNGIYGALTEYIETLAG